MCEEARALLAHSNPITLNLTLSLTLSHLKDFASTRDAGEWRPLGDRDSEGWDEAAAVIRAAARVPGASTSTCSAVRAVAGAIKGGTASHVTRMFAVRGGAFALGGAPSPATASPALGGATSPASALCLDPLDRLIIMVRVTPQQSTDNSPSSYNNLPLSTARSGL